MNAEKTNALCIFGAYVRGTFDAAASRGLLTQQSINTMLNSLIGLYGTDAFEVQAKEQIQPSIANVNLSLKDKIAGATAATKVAKQG